MYESPLVEPINTILELNPLMKKLFRQSLIYIIGTFFIASPLLAQQQSMPAQPEPLSPEEVTNSDLQLIANISESSQNIQQEADSEMREIVEEEGMEYARFQQIMMAQQNPQMAGSMELTESEETTLQKIQPQLMRVGQNAQQQYMSLIKEEGLSITKFQQIAQAIQTHPEVAKRFEKIKNESSEGEEDEDN